MLKMNWLASLLAMIMGLFSGLPGGLIAGGGKADTGAQVSHTTADALLKPDLSHTVLGPIGQSDFQVLARLVSAEAGGEPFEGQVAVGATVLNRVRSGRYASTIPGVVYQISDGHYQYSPVPNGMIDAPASKSSQEAALEALSGADPTGGALNFYNPAKTNDTWVRSQKVIRRIGNHVFMA